MTYNPSFDTAKSLISTDTKIIANTGTTLNLIMPTSGDAAFDIGITSNVNIVISGGTPNVLHRLYLRLRQASNTGPFSITFSNNIYSAAGSLPVVTQVIGSLDAMVLETWDGTNFELVSYRSNITSIGGFTPIPSPTSVPVVILNTNFPSNWNTLTVSTTDNINAALMKAAPGFTLTLNPGHYRQVFNVPVSLDNWTIVSSTNNPNDVIMDGGGGLTVAANSVAQIGAPGRLSYGEGVIHCSSPGTVKGLTVTGGGQVTDTQSDGQAGVYWQCSNGTGSVINCIITKNQNGVFGNTSNTNLHYVLTDIYFYNNGSTDGHSHDTYLNASDTISSLTATRVICPGSNSGNDLKSRLSIVTLNNCWLGSQNQNRWVDCADGATLSVNNCILVGNDSGANVFANGDESTSKGPGNTTMNACSIYLGNRSQDFNNPGTFNATNTTVYFEGVYSSITSSRGTTLTGLVTSPSGTYTPLPPMPSFPLANNIETLTINTIAAQTAGTAFAVTGSYVNTTLTVADYAIAAQGVAVSSLTWTPVTFNSVPASGAFAFNAINSTALSSAVLWLRDHLHQTIVTNSNTFAIGASVTPALYLNTPTNVQPGASYTITGSYVNINTTPTIKGSLNNGALSNLPTGSTVSAPVSGAGTINIMMVGATAGTYTYYISDQNGHQSLPITYSISAAKPLQGVLTATAGDGHVLLNYAENSGSTGVNAHNLYSGATQAACLANTTAVPVTFDGSGNINETVTNGTTMWYQVTSINAAGEGPRSNFVYGTPQAAGGSGVVPSWTPLTFTGAAGTAPTGNSHITPNVTCTSPLQNGDGTITITSQQVTAVNGVFDAIGKIGDGMVTITFAAGSSARYQFAFRVDSAGSGLSNAYWLTNMSTLESVISGTYHSGVSAIDNYYPPEPTNDGDTASYVFNGEQLALFFNGNPIGGYNNSNFATGAVNKSFILPSTNGIPNVAGPGYIGIWLYDKYGSYPVKIKSISFVPIENVPVAMGGKQGAVTAPTQGSVAYDANGGSNSGGSSGGNSGGSSGGNNYPSTDGYAPGIYAPDNVYVASGCSGYPTIYNAFVRGATVAPTTTFSALPPGVFLRSGPTGMGLGYNGGADIPVGSYPVTQTTTDGVNTWTHIFNIVSTPVCREVGNYIALDTLPGSNQSNGPNTGFIGDYSSNYQSGETLTDPSGFIQIYNFGGKFVVQNVANISTHYGRHDCVLHCPADTNGNPAFDQPLSFWFAHEYPALPKITLNPIYTSTPVGAVLAVINIYTESGIHALTFSGTPALLVQLDINYSNTVATITTSANLPVGATNFVLNVLSNTGLNTPITVNYTVQQGTVLPATNITANLLTTLDNSMATAIQPAPIQAGTFTVTGISNPTWYVSVVGENPLTDGSGQENILIPCSFTIDPATQNNTTANLQGVVLSARTYQIVATAISGGLSCISNPFSITIADCRTFAGIKTVTIVPNSGASTATTAASYNEALDVYWNDPIGHKGMTIAFAGGIYNSDFNTANSNTHEFNRQLEGHGSNQPYGPGPVTIQGPSSTNPVIITFNGAWGGDFQAGLYAKGGDWTIKNAVLKECQNPYQSDNNGAIYKEGTSTGDCTLQDTKIWNSCDGFINGDAQLSVINMINTVFGYCGTGTVGLTHNIYGGLSGQMNITNLLSVCNQGGHELKQRAFKSVMNNIVCIDGQNGRASNQLDIPVGGEHTITNFYFHKGTQPNNNGIIVDMMEDGVHGAHPTNTIVFDGGYVVATVPNGALTAPTYGFYQGPLISPTTGLTPSITVKNTKFFGVYMDKWFAGGVIDGGGNSFITTWPDMPINDPTTGQPVNPAHAPIVPYLTHSAGENEGLYWPVLEFQTKIVANAAVNTYVTKLIHFDKSGTPLVNPVFSIPPGGVVMYSSPGGSTLPDTGFFKIDQQGTITVKAIPSFTNPGITGTNVNGIAYIGVQVSGTDFQGNAKTYQTIGFVVVGTGYNPGYATQGGAVVADGVNNSGGSSGSSRTINVDTPSAKTAGQTYTVTGEYTGAVSNALDYSNDNGNTWNAGGSPTVANNIFGFSAVAGSAGTGQIKVRDHNNQSVIGTSGTFTINAAPTGSTFTGNAGIAAGTFTLTPATIPADVNGNLPLAMNDVIKFNQTFTNVNMTVGYYSPNQLSQFVISFNQDANNYYGFVFSNTGIQNIKLVNGGFNPGNTSIVPALNSASLNTIGIVMNNNVFSFTLNGNALPLSLSDSDLNGPFSASVLVGNYGGNNPTVTVSSVNITPIAAAPTVPSTALTDGIHFEDTVYTTPDSLGYSIIMTTGVVIGLDPTVVPTITLTGTNGTSFFQTGPNYLSLAYGISQAVGSYPMTWTATDGTKTFTKNFTVVSRKTGGVNINNNYITDQQATYTNYICDYQVYDSTGLETVTDSTSFFSGNGNQQIIAVKKSNIASNLGMRTVNINYPSSAGNQTHAVPIYLLHELNPIFKIAYSPAYTSTPVGTVIATITPYSVVGVNSVVVDQSDNTITCSYSQGIATIITTGPQTLGAKSFRLTFTSSSGLITISTQNYTVAQGTILPPTNMTLNIPTNLDNYVLNQVVGTPSVTGITGTPKWTFQNQDNTVVQYGGDSVMFTMNPNTGLLAFAKIAAARPEGHTVIISCTDGPNTCTQTFNIPVAWKVGPTVHIGRGMSTAYPTGYGFEHFSDILPTLNNGNNGTNAQYAGATLVFHADSDPDYFAEDNCSGNNPALGSQNGYARFGMFGPLRFVSSDPNGPRVRVGGYVNSSYGGVDPSGKGFFTLNTGDFYFNGFEISFCQGYGSPDTDYSHGVTGLRKNADCVGDVEVENCCFHDNNNGMESGEGPTKVTVHNCVAYNNGGQTVSSGQTHAFYLDGSQLIFHDNISYNNNIGHCLKSRAIKGHIYNNRLYDGEGGSCSQQLNIPQGGVYLVENNDFHKGPNPQNPYCLGYGEDCSPSNNYGGHGCHSRLTALTLKNNRFFVGGVVGLHTGPPRAIVHWQAISGIDGSPSQIYADGNSFYLGCSNANKLDAENLFPANTNTWIETNSTTLTTPFALDFSDPGTAVPKAATPGFYNFLFYAGDDMQNMYGVQIKPDVKDIRVSANAPAGTNLTGLTAYGSNFWKSDNVANDIRVNPFIAGTTWSITQDNEYFSSQWAAVGKYQVVANSDGTAATLQTGSVARTVGYDVIKVRATAPNGTLADWRLSIVNL